VAIEIGPTESRGKQSFSSRVAKVPFFGPTGFFGNSERKNLADTDEICNFACNKFRRKICRLLQTVSGPMD